MTVLDAPVKLRLDHVPAGTETVAPVALPAQFRIGAIDVNLSCVLPDVREEYAALYSGFERGHESADSLAIFVRRGRSRYTLGRRVLIGHDDERMFSVRQVQQVLPHLEWAVNWAIIRKIRRYLQLHAGVMSLEGRGIVMAGQPGSGKTTLSAGLMARGWQYLSDEFALIDRAGRLQPYPKALCVKQGSFAVIERLGLPMFAPHRYKKGRKGRVAYLPSTCRGRDGLGQACRLHRVFFPTHVPGAPPRIEPISRGQAAFELTRLSFNMGQLGDAGMQWLLNALADARCYHLTHGDIDESCDLIEAVTRVDD